MSDAAEPTVIPYILVKNAARAIDFYKSVFGAEECGARFTDPSGRIGHAELQIGNSKIMLADEHPPAHVFAPMLFFLRVPDADAAVQKAVAAGATLSRPIANEAYGERSGVVQDPFGHSWMISAHVEDLTKRELQQRVAGEYEIS